MSTSRTRSFLRIIGIPLVLVGLIVYLTIVYLMHIIFLPAVIFGWAFDDSPWSLEHEVISWMKDEDPAKTYGSQ